jgi:hypothetical protein
MSNGVKVLLAVAAVLAMGATAGGAHAYGWMGHGHQGMMGGYGGMWGEGEGCFAGSDAEYDFMEGHCTKYLEEAGVSAEDIEAVEAIMDEAHAQIAGILSSYDLDELDADMPEGGCCD